MFSTGFEFVNQKQKREWPNCYICAFCFAREGTRAKVFLCLVVFYKLAYPFPPLPCRPPLWHEKKKKTQAHHSLVTSCRQRKQGLCAFAIFPLLLCHGNRGLPTGHVEKPKRTGSKQKKMVNKRASPFFVLSVEEV